MTRFLPALALLAAAATANAQSPRPPQAPPLAFGITVGGQGLGIDVGNKTVTIPGDWKVVVNRPATPKAASVGLSGSVTYAEACELVKAGETVTVFVGVSPRPVPAGKWASTYYLEGVAPGIYLAKLGATGPELIPAPAVAAPVPFVASPTTLPTYAPPVVGLSTSRIVSFQAGVTRTVAPPTGPFGGIGIGSPFGGGCAGGQCASPDFGLFRPFGGFFRR